MRVVAQATQFVDGTSFAPGDVLPASLHSWPLLPDAVRRGSMTVEGVPSSVLLDASTGSPLQMEPHLVLGFVRRGLAVSSDPREPAPMHAAAIVRDLLAQRGHVAQFPGPLEASAEMPAADVPAAVAAPERGVWKKRRG